MEKLSSRRVTLADVAALAGTSTTAVSLVLNDRPGTRLSAQTSARIKQAAADLGYRPNQAARSLRLGRTQTIGFISDDVTVTRYASAMIRGVLDAAEADRHTVLIAETGTTGQRTRNALASMVDRCVDGLIIAVMQAREIDVPDLPADLPVVLLNASSPDHLPCVLRDERTAGRDVVRALLDAGHSDIAVLGWSDEWFDNPRLSNQAGERQHGIREALDAAGVTPRLLPASWDAPQDARAATHRLWTSGEAPTGIIALNDRIAFGAHQALLGLGVRLPDEASIVSFDDEELAGYLEPALTTARIPYEEMGRTAVQMLLHPDDHPRHTRLAMPLQWRGSIATPRA